MKLRQYYLTKLAEECAEVAQRALKQSQFGVTEVQKGQELTNKERLGQEVDDLISVLYILKDLDEVDILSKEEFLQRYALKKAKIAKYLKYSQELGMVDHD